MDKLIELFQGMSFIEQATAVIVAFMGAMSALSLFLRAVAKFAGLVARLTATTVDDNWEGTISAWADSISWITDKAAQILKWLGGHVGSEPANPSSQVSLPKK